MLHHSRYRSSYSLMCMHVMFDIADSADDHSQRQSADTGSDDDKLDMAIDGSKGGIVDDDCDVILTDPRMIPDGMRFQGNVSVKF